LFPTTWLLIIHGPRASRRCQYAAELAKIIVHGDLVTQTLPRRDDHAFRPPRLDSGARDSQQLCGDRDRHAQQLSAPVLQQLPGGLSDILASGPLRHPVQQGNVIKDLHSVLELACDRHAHHLAL
jgi:hypothetical protein